PTAHHGYRGVYGANGMIVEWLTPSVLPEAPEAVRCQHEDYQVALATYRAACERWPSTPITLRQGARLSRTADDCDWRKLSLLSATSSSNRSVAPESHAGAQS